MQLETLLDPTGSSLTLMSGLKISVALCDLETDLLTPKVDRFMSFLCGPLVPIGIQTGLFIFKTCS